MQAERVLASIVRCSSSCLASGGRGRIKGRVCPPHLSAGVQGQFPLSLDELGANKMLVPWPFDGRKWPVEVLLCVVMSLSSQGPLGTDS